MHDKTYTFTARSADNPEEVATFTLYNESISLQLGETLVEQAEQATAALRDEDENALAAWARPLATGVAQRILQPVPIGDFSAEIDNDTLKTTAWVRAGGLRLLPVSFIWEQVDNPVAAQAFVHEVKERKEHTVEEKKLPNPFDYWAGWVVVGVLTVILPLLWLRLMQQRLSGENDS